MRNLFFLLSFLTFLLVSCQQENDYEETWLNKEGLTPMHVSVSSANGVDPLNITLFVYAADTLYFEGKTDATGSINVEIPMNETFEIIAVLDAEEFVKNEEKLSTFTLLLDEDFSKEIYASKVISFRNAGIHGISLPVKIERMVGKVSFVPTETQDGIDAITEFDLLAVTFDNIVGEYRPKGGLILTDYTMRTSKQMGFSASIYSFPVAGRQASLRLTYYSLSGAIFVTETAENIPSEGVNIINSRETRVKMSLFENAYLTVPFGPVASPLRSKAAEGYWVEDINF